MTLFIKQLIPVVQRDPRFAYEAYEFVNQALEHTHKMLGRAPATENAEPNETRYDVSPRQWVEGICDFARQEFGLMARVVFRQWGIRRTDDFGAIVFNLIDAGLIRPSPDEGRADFHDLLDLDEALVHGFRIVLEDEQ